MSDAKSNPPKGDKNIERHRHRTSWLSDLRYGRSISIEFFRHNAWLIVAMLVAVISLIGLRYKTKTKMQEIKSLTRELKQAESAKLKEKAAYMSLIREMEMKRLVNERGLGLAFQEQPPYEVEGIGESSAGYVSGNATLQEIEAPAVPEDSNVNRPQEADMTPHDSQKGSEKDSEKEIIRSGEKVTETEN